MEAKTLLQMHDGLSKRKRSSIFKLDAVRNEIKSNHYPSLSTENLLIFSAGSLGRHEFGTKSDLDLFLISDGARIQLSPLEEIRILGQVVQLNDDWVRPRFSGRLS